MVISSLYIETIKGRAEEVSKKLTAFEGVELHHIEDEFKVIISLESETIDESYKIAESFKDISGILTINLVYSAYDDEYDVESSEAAVEQ